MEGIENNLIRLRINRIHFDQKRWWEDADLILRILTSLEEAIRAEGYQYFGQRGKKKKKFSDPKALATAYKWDYETYEFTRSEKDSPTYEGGLTLDLGVASELVLYLEIRQPYRDDAGRGAMDLMVRTVRRLYDMLGKSVSWGPSVWIEISHFSFPRVRPMHDFGGQPANPETLITFLAENFYLPERWQNRSCVDDLRQAPVPDGFIKEEFGGLTMIRLVEDLTSRTLLRERLMAFEDWLIEVLKPELGPSYNEFGDMRVPLMNPQPAEGATFVSFAAAFKAVVLDPDGNLDEDVIQELLSYLSQGKLPDGTKIDSVRLILPNRESAVKIHDTALARGIKTVVYATDDGQLWDPFPLGEWREWKKPAGAR
ncbi:MAG: hypothetical protein F9K24_21905 [Leptonema illini]|uniref:Uncharacterized protein n=1 Tax=Leptonema illini TaxID=183 RepID=A0A833GWX7_9LEPT|nr:MAG: hypothetical protein F9K24_21905 [Leptonema illini]